MSTEDDFKGFALCKAYDVIADGGFKRHLVASRDNGDAWAVKMHGEQGRVTHLCKDVINSINHLHEIQHNKEWARICRDVLGSAQPPMKVFMGPCTCIITGDKIEHALDLTKNGKAAKETRVHLKFWHFFILLWYVSKVEYIIRSCTKQWLEEIGMTQRKECEYTGLCERFRDEYAGLIDGMAKLFTKAYSYVQESVKLYKTEFEVNLVVMPPAAAAAASALVGKEQQQEQHDEQMQQEEESSDDE